MGVPSNKNLEFDSNGNNPRIITTISGSEGASLIYYAQSQAPNLLMTTVSHYYNITLDIINQIVAVMATFSVLSVIYAIFYYYYAGKKVNLYNHQ